MSNLNPTKLQELNFTLEDLELFKIPDNKECVLALQKYFFPRLEYLLKESLDLTERFYKVDARAGMSTALTPSNRLNTATIKRPEFVSIAHTGQRRSKKKNNPLNITNLKGNPIYIHPAYLGYKYDNAGWFEIEFRPFCFSVSLNFVEQLRKNLQENLDLFVSNSQNIPLFFLCNEVIDLDTDLEKFIEIVSTPNFGIENDRDFYGISFFIGTETPDKETDWDTFLNIFLFLYPLFDLCIAIADGRESHWIEMMKIYDHILLEEESFTDTESFHLESKYSNDDKHDKTQELDRTLEIGNDFDPDNIEDDRKRRQMDVVQREGQEKFRAELFQVYSGKCAVTQCDVPDVLEAAHIMRYSGIDSNHVQNGLLLRKDIHTLFDRMLLTIDASSMQILIAPELIGSCYEILSNQKIYLPEEIQYYPSIDSLKRHNFDFTNRHDNHPIEKFKE
jgi:hypothetical protein